MDGDQNGYLEAFKDIYSVDEEIKSVCEALKVHLHKTANEAEEYTYEVVCSTRFSKQLLLGSVLMLGIQFSAVNVFTYYSTSIFLKTMDLKEATLFTTLLGVGQVCGAIVSIFIFGRVSKKITILVGFFLIFCILFIVSILTYTNNFDPIKYLLILFFFTFGASVFTSYEIQANILPDLGLSILGFVNWAANVLVVVTLPYMLASPLEFQWTCMLYSILLGIIIIYIGLFYKETVGRTINEVEEVYQTWM